MLLKVFRLFHTVRYLKMRQLWCRFFFAVRKKQKYVNTGTLLGPYTGAQLNFVDPVPRFISSVGGQFTFLNRTHKFGAQIDWDLSTYGKLWTYNLNYFDFLNQEGMSQERGLKLIWQFIAQLDNLENAWEPYPISLRLMNWIKFLSREKLRDPAIDQSLYVQTQALTKQLEYHLLGNHLLENGFALLFAAIFFADEHFLRLAKKILIPELKEQILADGAHFELSPMYHQILLDRLLDCINLLQNNRPFGEELLPLLDEKASLMLGWLEAMTFDNGTIPLFNDAADGIAPTSKQLFDYAERLGVERVRQSLGPSGYRRLTTSVAELLVDVGAIGPDYIPGHAHADTLNFELSLFGKRVIIDSGTSTYEKTDERQRQRGTEAHNTVVVDGENSSEVWGGFRVARRAKTFDLEVMAEDGGSKITCSHDGYKRLPGKPVHSRTWTLSPGKLNVGDRVTGGFKKAVAHYYFHPDLKITLLDSTSGQGQLVTGQIFTFSILSGSAALIPATWHPEFNVGLSNTCLQIVLEGGSATVQFKWEDNENFISDR